MFSLLPDVVVQFLDGHGKPLAGGLVYTYESGTTTLKPTFADPEGKTPNTNPIVLDAAGRAKIYLDTGAYRVRVLSRDQVLITDTNQVSRFVNNIELAEVLKTVNDGLAELGVVQEALESLVDEAFRDQKGHANGIAPLDAEGKIPAEYLSKVPKASFTEHGTVRISGSFNNSAELPEVALSVDGGKALAARDFGRGAYKDVKIERNLGSLYRTSTTVGRMLFIRTTRRSDASQELLWECGGVNMGVLAFIHDSYPSQLTASIYIPPNTEYRISAGTGSPTIDAWFEID